MAETRGAGGSSVVKVLPSITNQGYFTEYFLSYRLDAGLDGLYKHWDAAEREGYATARSRVKGLSAAMAKHRVDAASASPGNSDGDDRLDLGLIPTGAVGALRQLNDSILRALGWEPERGGTVTLTSGGQMIHVPVAHRCATPSGTLLLALDGVFCTDPSKVVAGKETPAGTLLEPIQVGDKPEGITALEAAQLIFTADEPPNYLLICSGGAITLLDRDRWGEGVFLGADLDDAVARGDARPSSVPPWRRG